MSGSERTYEGSCLCGSVRYRFTGEPTKMTHCHCTDCRKHSGAAIVTFIEVPLSRFTIERGKESLATHKAQSGTSRSFCRVCGSSILSFTEQDREFTYLNAATLDTRLERKPDYHIFVRSRVPWYDIRDGLPQHAAYPES